MKTLYLVLALAVICVGPVFAQRAFTDVPEEHWAYDAVDELQQEGLIAGYPNGTFQGKNPITRYEFAMVIQRLLPLIQEGEKPTDPKTGQPVDLFGYATKADVDSAVKGIQIPDVSGLAKKSDVDTISRLVNEFKDELAALGVDVDGVKRDLAALSLRVEAIENELKRVRWEGTVNVFGISVADKSTGGNVLVDKDNRVSPMAPNDALIRSAAVVRDFDLDVTGRVNENVTAKLVLNAGNYLNYVGDVAAGGGRMLAPTDNVFPYYAYIAANMGAAKLTMGRFGMQLTPYTFKMIDQDSYTTNVKTDSGDYPVDGAKVDVNLLGVDWTWFAAKHDSNIYAASLVGQQMVTHWLGTAGFTTGGSVGGLSAVTATAGVRATAKTPFNGKLGATYYRAFDRGVWPATYDTADVMGVDLALPVFGLVDFKGAATSSTAKSNAKSGGIDYKGGAYDFALGGNIGGLGLGVGYKSIDRDFATAGNWDSIGRWVNPTNVEGIYADIKYPLTSTISLAAGGEFLTAKKTAGKFAEDDKIDKIAGGIKWAYSQKSAFSVDYQLITFEQKAAKAFKPWTAENAKESYLTVGWAHKLGANADLKVGYQFVNYSDGVGSSTATYMPYGMDYRGGIGVVQMGVNF